MKVPEGLTLRQHKNISAALLRPIGILKAVWFAKVFQGIGMWAAVAAELWTYTKPWITHWSGGLSHEERYFLGFSK